MRAIDELPQTAKVENTSASNNNHTTTLSVSFLHEHICILYPVHQGKSVKRLLIISLCSPVVIVFLMFFSTVTSPLSITCPGTQTVQNQCSNVNMVSHNFPVATVTGGSGTVSAVTYSATGATFAAPANNQVTGTFPTSPTSQTVTASVTDSAGTRTCIFLFQVTQGNNCNINESATQGSKWKLGFIDRFE